MIRLELLHTGFLWRDRPHVSRWYERLKSRDSARTVFDCYSPASMETLTSRGRDVAGRVEHLVSHMRGAQD